MKKSIIAVLCGLTLMSSCNTNKDKGGYIPRQEITLADGVMTPQSILALGKLTDPQISPDGKKVLYGVSYTDVAENRSCRNLFMANTDGSDVIQLTRYAKSVSNARWSLDSKSIFFLQEGQLWRAPLNGKQLGKKVKLSNVTAGINEFLLSPDQSKVIYTSTIPGPVQTPKDYNASLDKAQAYSTESLMYRHWDHWVTETPRSYVAGLEGIITPENSRDIIEGEPYELPTEPFAGIEQLTWSPDGRYIAYSCRKATGIEYAFSTDTEIYLYNVETGHSTVIPMAGGYDTDPVWNADGTLIAWLSMARNGYESDLTRLMVADTDLSGETPVVSGVRDLTSALDHDAGGIVWSEDGRTIYFNALTDGLQALYSVKADGSSPVQRITPQDWWYDFFSPWGIQEREDGLHMLASYYSLQFPLELVDITCIDGKAAQFTQITHENDHILSQLAENKVTKENIKTIDGQDMLAWVIYPQEFDPGKKYPAIEICLGGPQGTLSQSWSYRWCYRLMAQQGYVVIMPNRRGTTSSGQAWKEQISGDYSGLNIQDYLSAARWLKAKPYIGKLAACGASYGGYSVYYLAGVHGDTYDCFIAHAGIFDEEYLYYTTEEMWFANWDNGGLTEYAYQPGQQGPAGDGITFGGMQQAGSPWASTPKAQHHYANSPHTNVANWHTPILCIHGGMDFRIPYDQGMAAFNSAQMMGVPSKLVIFPTETHWILQPQNALYWHNTYFDWLDRWIK